VLGDAFLESGQRLFGLLLQTDVDEHVQIQTQGFGVGQCHITLDHACRFECLHPGQTGGGREMHTAGQLHIGQRSVVL